MKNITVQRDGQNFGPFSLEELRQHLAAGSFLPNDWGFIEGTADWVPLESLFPKPQSLPLQIPRHAPKVDLSGTVPSCNVCHAGGMQKKKVYRMSTPVVIIGYILLIPSVLGVLMGVLFLFATGAGTSATVSTIQSDVRQKLVAAQVPSALIDKVVHSTPITDEESSSLTPGQQVALQNAQSSVSGGTAGAGIGAFFVGGLSIAIIISSFVGGLLGWLLIMKKKILQCSNCSYAMAAS